VTDLTSAGGALRRRPKQRAGLAGALPVFFIGLFFIYVLAFLGGPALSILFQAFRSSTGHFTTQYVDQLLGNYYAKTYATTAALSPMTALIGVVAGLGAVALRWLISAFHNLAFLATLSGDYNANIPTPPSPFGAWASLVPVDHTTVSAAVTRELFGEAKGHGVSFIDAPISGGQAGAENGVLSVMCGGDQAAYDKAEPVIDAYAKICRRIGGTGAGQTAKMMNQICIAGLVQGLSEALAFGEKAGLDGAAVVEVISQGAAGSWQMANRYKTMLAGEFEHGFAVDWMRKDLAICLATGEELGAALPVTALVDQFYKDVQSMGGGRWDTSSLIKRLKAFDG